MIRLGLVDFDSSHAVEFTRRINHCALPVDQYVEGAQVVLGFPGSSPAQDRIEQFTPQVVACGVELVDHPERMIGRIDAVLVLSLQGDRHTEAARPFLEAGVPTYIDKPITCNLVELDNLIGLARRNRTLVWSSSAARFADDLTNLAERMNSHGPGTGLQVFGPAHFSNLNRGLFHYGIHITETAFKLLGQGCDRLSLMESEQCDLVAARWNDGRIATLRGQRAGHTGYGVTCFTRDGILHENLSLRSAYRNLCQEIVNSFETNTPPVGLDETREIIRFLDAAEQSRAQAGRLVFLN